MLSLLGDLFRLRRKRVAPAHVESDDIFPVHFLDDTPANRSITLSWTFRFNDVLDADKLHDSLCRLLGIGEWRKLGGRLRMRDDGRLEIHVPKKITPERPAVHYSRLVFQTRIGEHPLGSRLPKPTAKLSLQEDPATFQSLTARPGVPSSLNDYIYSDEPLLSLHVVSFTDATLVCISWPHVLADAFGQRALLIAWSQVLAGRENEVRPLLGTRQDVLETVRTAPNPTNEPYVLGPMQLKGVKLVWFAARFAWEMIRRPKLESRTIFLPAAFIGDLRRRALEDLKSEENAQTPFVSEGDVLTAWGTRLVSAAAKPPAVMVTSSVDLRGRIASLASAPGVFMSNILGVTFTNLSSFEARAAPLGRLAHKFRESITEQLTEPQISAFLGLVHRAFTTTGRPPIFGKANSMLLIFSNWTKFGFFDAANFAPAVVGSSNPHPDWPGRPGRVVYYHSHHLVRGIVSRNFFTILGRDPGGSYWVNAILPPGYWRPVQDEVEGNQDIV